MAIREIIFRGKRVDNGEWVYSSFIMQDKEHKLLSAEVELFDGENWRAVIPETFGEYTGLKDKNGKKIFEGDICKTYFESYTHSWEEVGVVTEFCGAYGIESADGKHFRAFINESVYTCSYEVIGNMHDNKELLYEN